MASREFGLLRINILRGGTAAEIASFFSDLDSAYNALYLFDQSRERFRRRLRHFRGFLPDEFWHLDQEWLGVSVPPYLAAEYMLPSDRLEVSRISINSPGWAEVLGKLNPLEQARLYLQDRHERAKDKDYRNASEKERLILENELLQRQIMEKDRSILKDDIAILRELGVDDETLRQACWQRLGIPLARLGRHQDTGLIGGPQTPENGDDYG